MDHHDREAVDTNPTPSSLGSVSNLDNGTAANATPSPVATEPQKRVIDHDSLVTVRLSEPPTLHVNTSIPPSSLPSRRTVYGIEYTPSETMAESLQEEDGSDTDMEAETPALERRPTLEDELRETNSDSEGEEDEGGRSSEERPSSESDRVNWEQLQETEDMEAKDQNSDNVSLPRFATVRYLINPGHSLRQCCSPG
jgi:hypothetical protein